MMIVDQSKGRKGFGKIVLATVLRFSMLEPGNGVCLKRPAGNPGELGLITPTNQTNL
jgi:hypothetical protein